MPTSGFGAVLSQDCGILEEENGELMACVLTVLILPPSALHG